MERRLTLRSLASLTLALMSAAGALAQSGRPDEGGPPGPPSSRLPDEDPPDRDERAEQVLRSAIRAHGGEQAITGRQSVYLKYRVTNFEYPEPEVGTITIWFKRPLKIRQEVAYSHRKEIRVFDGERAWVDDGTGPKLLGPMVALMMERGIRELDSPLQYLDGTLHYLSLAKDPFGRMTQKLSWRHHGYARDLMIDVATSRVLVVGEFDTPAGAISRMRLFDDYRPVQGIMVPFREETYRNDQRYTERQVLEAKFNLPVDDSIFAYTGPEAPPPPPDAAGSRPSPPP